MSLSKRVNVFLERARNLQPTSPKLSNPARSPTKHLEDRQGKPSSPAITQAKQLKPPPEASLISDIEQMIDSFLRNRSDTLKRVISTQHKELQFVEEVKKTIEAEKLKSKNSGFANIEKEYKDKAEKILMIVKQEASRIDAKLVEFQAENLKLKLQLSEKNIEAVDRKLQKEIFNIEQVLNELRGRAAATAAAGGRGGVGRFGNVEKLIGLKGVVFDGSLDGVFEEVAGDDENYCSEIAERIVAEGLKWDDKVGQLEIEIERRRRRYQSLDQKIKNFYQRRCEVRFEDEDFGTRQVRSETFGNAPKPVENVPKPEENGRDRKDVEFVNLTQNHPDLQNTVQNLLNQVFSDIILEIDTNTFNSNSE